MGALDPHPCARKMLLLTARGSSNPDLSRIVETLSQNQFGNYCSIAVAILIFYDHSELQSLWTGNC